MICWDLQYASAAQALAAQGAEIILCPIWGGNPSLVKARAIENQLYLVLCGYDIASTIHDPWGKLSHSTLNRPEIGKRHAAQAAIDQILFDHVSLKCR